MNGLCSTSGLDVRYKFTGKERDTETNYDYFGARYYDSRIARWLQVDPLADKYPGWSTYNYTLNNPIVYIDPFGMDVYHYKPDGRANGVDKAVWWKPWTWKYSGPDKDVIDLPNGGTQDWGGQIVAGSIDNAEATSYNFLTRESISSQVREPGIDYNVLGPVESLGLAKSLVSGAIALKSWYTSSKSFTYTNTAAQHLNRLTKSGNLSRPYMRSPLTIKEIMATGKGVQDATARGALNFKVPGTFRGSEGTWELVVDPNTNLIYHFNFRSGE